MSLIARGSASLYKETKPCRLQKEGIPMSRRPKFLTTACWQCYQQGRPKLLGQKRILQPVHAKKGQNDVEEISSLNRIEGQPDPKSTPADRIVEEGAGEESAGVR